MIKPISTLCLMGFSLSLGGQTGLSSPTGSGDIIISVLGVAQDAGYPQINCKKICCERAWKDPGQRKSPVCLGISDAQTRENWLVEATPAIKYQWQILQQLSSDLLQGILLTHAHAGHYTGLLELGKEMLGAAKIPVYTLPRFNHFLKTNGPWSQLVEQKNIELHIVQADSAFQLNARITCIPLLVPHRDEFSETAGFIIRGPRKSLLFIPDIDKWDNWSVDLRQILPKMDYALLDATFFKEGELEERNMAEIPHPFVVETIRLLSDLPDLERKKVYFIHFNHTNPLIRDDAAALQIIDNAGMNIAKEGLQFSL